MFCVYKAFQIWRYRKTPLILAMLKKGAFVLGLSQDPAWKKLIKNWIGNCVSSSSFCCTCYEHLVFYVINKYFNSIDKSFIVN